MSESDATRWTIIQDAAAGDRDARQAFAKRYLPAVRAYLGARWRQAGLHADLEDAAQEVFLECFKRAGVLERADPKRGGFRALLFGVTRNVARRFEARRGRRTQREATGPSDLDALVADDDGPSEAFDRAWAAAVMRQAGALMLENARRDSAEALRRVELLKLRVIEGTAIRHIATAWGVDATSVHRAYARARREFKAALLSVLGGLEPGPREDLEAECTRLLALFG